MRTRWAFLVSMLLIAILGGVLVFWQLEPPDGKEPTAVDSAATTEQPLTSTFDDNEAADTSETDEANPLLEHALTPWTGDLDGMIERRMIRALVAYSKTFFFLDGATMRGLSYEALNNFETHLNKKLNKKSMPVQIVFIPVSRDRLIPGLVEGLGDLAVANLTITPERAASVEFSDPVHSDVSELLVTGPSAPPIESVADLAGAEIIVRRSSSYYDSLMRLNQSLEAAGKPPVRLTLANENLEDEDLLEMVNAGLYPMVVMDSHKATFWEQVFDDITVHRDIAINTGGQIAWAMRKDSPSLKQAVNAFVETSKAGTELGNVLLKRYLEDTTYVRNGLAAEERKKFLRYVDLFRTYAQKYDFDWLLIAAQAYQESGIEQDRRSRAGAVGVMQIRPKTAAADPINIPNVKTVENNIHAGVKYLRYIADTYFSDPAIDPFNRQLFAFAAYNAGPTRIANLRESAVKTQFDPDTWFKNVERIVAKKVGREPVNYVRNILKYYVAYKRILDQMETRQRITEEARAY